MCHSIQRKCFIILIFFSLLRFSWSLPHFEVRRSLVSSLCVSFLCGRLYDLRKIYHTVCASVIYQTLYPSTYQTSKYMLVECCTIMTESLKHPLIVCSVLSHPSVALRL